jgi:hypothetical protein
VTFGTLTNHVISYYDYYDISILNNSKIVTLTTICIVSKKVSPNLKEFDPIDKTNLFVSISNGILRYRFSFFNHAKNNISVNAVNIFLIDSLLAGIIKSVGRY